ncbi:MAG: amino acid carrier protein, partial [Deltaproteobacteria bacterium]|nr:amino acid carrier protein [Deltaproteobacteria bacterium]
LGKFVGGFFAIAFVFLAMNIGNLIQANTAAETLSASYGLPPIAVGLVLAALLFGVIIGGVKRIGDVTARLVPAMAILYVGFALIIILLNFSQIIPCFVRIFTDAFTGTAATGGFVGSTFIIAARMGIARGLFSNEAGMGSAPIAHSAAKTTEAISQGVVATLEPFIDTICICTMTALVILMTGVWQTSDLQGAALTVAGFTTGLPSGFAALATHVVNIGILLFAFSTIISWSYYGERALVYRFGTKSILPYRIIQCGVTVVGSVFALEFVWALGDFFIFFTTIPNLVAILIMVGLLHKETQAYFKKYT